MPEFIITWNIGYGDNARVIEADNIADAEEQAYFAAKEDFEYNASYGAEEYNEERAEELGA